MRGKCELVNTVSVQLSLEAYHANDRYGLGTCYLRTSKVRLAEYHYRKALEIHPQNAVLFGCVGMVSRFCPRLLIRELLVGVQLTCVSQTVERRGDKVAAYSLFDQAVRLAPDNALVRYRRAKMLISMKRYKVGANGMVFIVWRDSYLWRTGSN